MPNRRWILFGAVGALMASAAGVWWWPSHSGPVPQPPPKVAIDDPVVAGVVEAARTKVLGHPTDGAAWGLLGETLLANGWEAPSRECFAEAGRLDTHDPRWPYLEGVSLLLRDPVAAIPCWQRAAECPGNDVRALTSRLRWAEVLLENSRQVEAENVLRDLQDRYPDNLRVHFDLGLLAAARNDPTTAIGHFQKCVESRHAQQKACTHLSAMYAAQGKMVEAGEYARRAEKLPPDPAWPDPIMDECYSHVVGRQGLFLQAEKQYQQGNVRQAVEIFNDVIRMYPDEGRAYAKLGMILAESGDYRAAEEVLRAGIRVAPDTVQSHFFLAVSLFHQAERVGTTTEAGQKLLREAASSARRATELKPDHGFAHLYLGLASNLLGQKVEGRAALREAVRCTPESTDPHLHLGLALWDDGRADEAIAEIEAAVRLAGPNDKRARAALDRLQKARTKPGEGPGTRPRNEPIGPGKG